VVVFNLCREDRLLGGLVPERGNDARLLLDVSDRRRLFLTLQVHLVEVPLVDVYLVIEMGVALVVVHEAGHHQPGDEGVDGGAHVALVARDGRNNHVSLP